MGPAVQVSVPNGAGQWVSGAGQCPQRCRSDFALLTCARNRHSGPFSGAGPHHQIGPAPSTPSTCAIHPTHLHHSPTDPTDLRHPPLPPAPLGAPTWSTAGPNPRWHNALALIPPTAPPHATMCGGYQHTEPPPRNTQLGGWRKPSRAPLKGPRGFRFPSGIYSRGRMLFSQRTRRTSSLRSCRQRANWATEVQ